MKRLKPYLYTSLIAVGIFLLLFIIKGIYPFGKNSLIWGDMHDQITAFYYHFYDCVHGNKSLLVDFTTSGSINFFGILAYYILSPFSLIVLLVPRTDIYLVVSIIVALKIIACCITCLYFLRTFFKNMPSLLYITLALLYGFSGYGLMMYQITPWIDAMYMFPLVVIGLKKVLDLEKPTMYIITLVLSLIFSFYVTIITLIFIFLVSLIYIYVYKDKDTHKKAILSLGISTVLSMLISLVVIVPSYLQISVSYRLGFKTNELLNSRLGPITDKLCMFMFSGLLLLALFYIFKDYKKNTKFLKFYIPVLLLLLIPLIIEPVNKVWHFGSYASFPYRFGYVTTLVLIFGAGYYFNNYKFDKVKEIKNSKIISILVTIISSLIILLIAYKFKGKLQPAIYKLSLSYSKKSIFVFGAMLASSIIGCFTVLKLNKKLTKFSLSLIMIISLAQILSYTYIFVGMDKYQKILTSEYKVLGDISKDYNENDNFRVKNDAVNMLMNSGFVMKYNTLDHFTSLTAKTNIEALKKMGFASMWVKTYSRGSNLLIDAALANKYIITDKKLDNPYYKLVKTYGKFSFYELKNDLSYGFIINNNDTVLDKNNSFEIANSIYKNVLNTTDNIFEIDNNFLLDNLMISKQNNDLSTYKIIDKDYDAYFEKDVVVNGRKNLYLEVTSFLDNTKNRYFNKKFNLYINNKLFEKDAFTEPFRGVINLGVYENETVNIKLEVKRTTTIKEVAVGLMDTEKFDKFTSAYQLDTNIKFNKNTVEASVEGKDGQILFLPITYSDNFHAKLNGEKVDIIKLYDNYIGIKLVDGENNIKLTYIPKGLIPTLIISFVSIIISIVLIKTNLYNKLINNKLLGNMAYYLYLFMYITFIFIAYVLLILCFFVSYVKYIRI